MKKLILYLAVLATLMGGYFIVDGFLFDGIRAEEVKEDGFYGRYYSDHPSQPVPAVILIGGGHWGDYWASEFAKQGYVGLSLPYTREEGLPQLPEEIPLEYFAQAINWLKTQEDVDPDHVLVMGASKNSEIALSVASLYPQLVGGAIAYAPSSVSWSNTVLPFNSPELKPSLTFRGEDVPYLTMERVQGNEGNKIDTYAYWNAGLEKDSMNLAAIKVEQINGPVLLLSGKADEVWPSSKMADQIEIRLKTNSFAFPFYNLQYEGAGHLISTNPDAENDVDNRSGTMVIDGKTYKYDFGGSKEADILAKKEAKIKVFEFLEELR